MMMMMMGSGATTPKVWGYRPRDSHLGSFLTRQLSPVTTGWAYGSFGIGPLEEPNVHRSWLKCGSGPVVDKTYTLWMMITYAHFLLMLIFLYVNSKIPNCDFYTPICSVVLLTEFSNSPLTPTTFSGYIKPESLFGNGIDLAKGNRTLGDWCNLYIV
jgi:hypothetical protein